MGKICSKCKVEKDISEFHKSKSRKDGLQSNCKPCNNSTVRKWQSENPERFEAGWRKHSYGDEALLKKRARTYGISVDELKSLLDSAGGLCEICKEEPYRWLVIDHCHTTLKVRGVLCERCNQALGLFRDNVNFMKSAIEYLEKQ